MAQAVQFGAGNIGRGFMGQLFYEAGYETTFVEVSKELVRLINKRRQYPLRLLDAETRTEIDLLIDRMQAIDAADTRAVAEAVEQADVIGTAVGVGNLSSIAPLLLSGIQRRFKKKSRPVDIYLCENTLTASRILKEAVTRDMDDDIRHWTEENIGFVGTIVARMVPSKSDRFGIDDPLFVMADSYHSLPYDGHTVRGTPPPIEGMRAVNNFEAEVTRKLFTYNLGHAALAYLGHLRGYTYVHELFQDNEFLIYFNGALEEISEAILSRFSGDITRESQDWVRSDIRLRFKNPMIMDTVYRVGRDPIRKLGHDDRLVGSARLCLDQGIFPENIAIVCGAAFCYNYSGDPQAVELQKTIRDNGLEFALKKISGVDPESNLGRKIVESYQFFRQKRQS
jgi:mannitol-1-phosphate 5-dehydrogenase